MTNDNSGALLTTPNKHLTPLERELKKIHRSALKKCPRCTARHGKPVFYPATSEHFGVSRCAHDGLSSYCRPCMRELRLRSAALVRKTPLTMKHYAAAYDQDDSRIPPQSKRCSNPYCRKVYPLTVDYWTLDESSPDKMSARCRRCQDIDSTLPPASRPGNTPADEDQLFLAQLRAQAGQPGFDENGYPY